LGRARGVTHEFAYRVAGDACLSVSYGTTGLAACAPSSSIVRAVRHIWIFGVPCGLFLRHLLIRNILYDRAGRCGASSQVSCAVCHTGGWHAVWRSSFAVFSTTEYRTNWAGRGCPSSRTMRGYRTWIAACCPLSIKSVGSVAVAQSNAACSPCMPCLWNESAA
jgi:hypothetical protein